MYEARGPGTDGLRVRRVREGIDPVWLAEACEREPVLHVYAAWDLENAPGSTRFVTWGGDGPQRSYLLIWLGDPAKPVVHWVGEEPDDLALASEIPDEVSVAVVPERAIEPLRARFPNVAVEPPLTMARRPDRPPPEGLRTRARRLSQSHADALRAFADRYPDMLTRPYRAPRPHRRADLGKLRGPRARRRGEGDGHPAQRVDRQRRVRGPLGPGPGPRVGAGELGGRRRPGGGGRGRALRPGAQRGGRPTLRTPRLPRFVRRFWVEIPLPRVEWH